MPRRQPPNLFVNRARLVEARRFQQEVAKELLVEFARQPRQRKQSLERVAEGQHRAIRSVEEGPRSSQVAECREPPFGLLPKGKAQVTQDFREAGFAKRSEVLQQQPLAGHVARRAGWYVTSVLFELTEQSF